jgi:alkanesulfonate monooxygenase SsuD/methylene tetrahydromethanopterin reductase-like flavin-dependent oxidoreductase (luciferase family)
LKFGVRLPVSGPFANSDSIIETGLAAERLGYDFVTAHDHIERGESEKYHFAVGTVEAVDNSSETTNFFETITTFCFLAGMTKRIFFIPAAIVLPVRKIAVVAKQFQTAQLLSNGRFVFCVAIGNSEKDFEVTQNTWKKRAEKLDEDLRVARELFNSNRKPISFEGKYTKFSDAEFSPPVKLPIWVAGKSHQTLRRIATFGNGWMPSGITPDKVGEIMIDLEKALKEGGRSLSEIDVCIEMFVGIAKSSEEAQRRFGPTVRKFSSLPDIARIGTYTSVPVGSPEEIGEWIDRYKKVGVSHFEAKFFAENKEELLASIELFSKIIK